MFPVNASLRYPTIKSRVFEHGSPTVRFGIGNALQAGEEQFGSSSQSQKIIMLTFVIIRAAVAAEQRYELIQTLMAEAHTSKLPDGCLERRLYEEVDSHLQKLLFFERWSNRDAVDAYISSDRHKVVMGAVKVLGTLEDFLVLEQGQAAPDEERAWEALEILKREIKAREQGRKDRGTL